MAVLTEAQEKINRAVGGLTTASGSELAGSILALEAFLKTPAGKKEGVVETITPLINHLVAVFGHPTYPDGQPIPFDNLEELLHQLAIVVDRQAGEKEIDHSVVPVANLEELVSQMESELKIEEAAKTLARKTGLTTDQARQTVRQFIEQQTETYERTLRRQTEIELQPKGLKIEDTSFSPIRAAVGLAAAETIIKSTLPEKAAPETGRTLAPLSRQSAEETAQKYLGPQSKNLKILEEKQQRLVSKTIGQFTNQLSRSTSTLAAAALGAIVKDAIQPHLPSATPEALGKMAQAIAVKLTVATAATGQTMTENVNAAAGQVIEERKTASPENQETETRAVRDSLVKILTAQPNQPMENQPPGAKILNEIKNQPLEEIGQIIANKYFDRPEAKSLSGEAAEQNSQAWAGLNLTFAQAGATYQLGQLTQSLVVESSVPESVKNDLPDDLRLWLENEKSLPMIRLIERLPPPVLARLFRNWANKKSLTVLTPDGEKATLQGNIPHLLVQEQAIIKTEKNESSPLFDRLKKAIDLTKTIRQYQAGTQPITPSLARSQPQLSFFQKPLDWITNKISFGRFADFGQLKQWFAPQWQKSFLGKTITQGGRLFKTTLNSIGSFAKKFGGEALVSFGKGILSKIASSGIATAAKGLIIKLGASVVGAISGVATGGVALLVPLVIAIFKKGVGLIKNGFGLLGRASVQSAGVMTKIIGGLGAVTLPSLTGPIIAVFVALFVLPLIVLVAAGGAVWVPAEGEPNPLDAGVNPLTLGEEAPGSHRAAQIQRAFERCGLTTKITSSALRQKDACLTDTSQINHLSQATMDILKTSAARYGYLQCVGFVRAAVGHLPALGDARSFVRPPGHYPWQPLADMNKVRVGDLAVWGGGLGHIGVVTAVTAILDTDGNPIGKVKLTVTQAWGDTGAITTITVYVGAGGPDTILRYTQ